MRFSKKMEAIDRQLSETKYITHIEHANAALLHVVTPEGVEASDDHLFKDAYFGRDQVIVGNDLVEIQPLVTDIVIRSVIKHQGVKYDQLSEEGRGRLHHEARYRRLGGPEQQDIYDRLVEQYQIGQNGVYTYYGTVDATPQYIRLIDAYRKVHGDEILSRVEKQGDRAVTVEWSVLTATRWLSDRIAASDIGLLEFCRTNPKGLTWQVLRDGAASYLHEDGRLANANLPIASIEVQGLAYDALLMAADMVGSDEDKVLWRQQAERLRAETFKHFWLPDSQYWAMALDRDSEGHLRTLTTETSLPAELLDTGIFEDLPEGLDQEALIAPIVRKIFSSDFITPVGIRMRAKHHSSLLPYADYQGSEAVWPVVNNIIAKGLRRYGLQSGARVIEQLSLAGTQAVGAYPEFIMVDSDGVVCWPLVLTETTGVPTLLATNVPELNQAWTISACLRMLHADVAAGDTAGWQQHLMNEIGADLNAANSATTEAVILTKAYYIDKEKARAYELGIPYAS